MLCEIDLMVKYGEELTAQRLQERYRTKDERLASAQFTDMEITAPSSGEHPVCLELVPSGERKPGRVIFDFTTSSGGLLAATYAEFEHALPRIPHEHFAWGIYVLGTQARIPQDPNVYFLMFDRDQYGRVRLALREDFRPLHISSFIAAVRRP